MTPAIILALAAATSSAAVTATSRYAVVIGHNHTPDPERASLRYADDDAARFYELLAPTLQDGALLAAFDDESQRTFASLIAVETASSPPLPSFLLAPRPLRFHKSHLLFLWLCEHEVA